MLQMLVKLKGISLLKDVIASHVHASHIIFKASFPPPKKKIIKSASRTQITLSDRRITY